MRKQIFFWFLALLLTIAIIIFQRMTGPTHSISKKIDFSGSSVSYEFERSHTTDSNQPVYVSSTDTSISGTLFYRRHLSQDDWTAVPMQRFAETLVGELPKQPAAGKIAYRVELCKDEDTLILPVKGIVITRFRGAVPSAILIPHILFIFLFFLLAIRSGLEAIQPSEHLLSYTLWTLVMLTIGGMIMGPIVQKFAFSAYWTGFPNGTDLTDNKTLIAFITWLIALLAIWKKPQQRGWIIAAALITVVVFLIPHSLYGSELNYTQMETTLP